MVGARLWSAEQRHHSIAGELLYHSALCLDGGDDLGEELVQHAQQRYRVELFRQRGEAANVLKENADFDALTGKGHAAAQNRIGHITGDEPAERVLDMLALL